MAGPAFEFREGTYEENVARLAEVIATAKPTMVRDDVAYGDQYDSASQEASAFLGTVADRLGGDVQGEEPSPDVMARMQLAWMSCHPCPHIKKNSAQPAIAQLALHRLVCKRCSNTVVNPPAENADRCDWCGDHGHTDFWPEHMTFGPVVIVGDACDNCHAHLAPAEPPPGG